MKRLFIALNLPADLHETLDTFLTPYKTHTALRSAKWVPRENLHVTALFLGEVPDALLPEITELTRGVCGRMHPFELLPEQVTLFPQKNHAKMLWLKYQKNLAFDEFVTELKRYLSPVAPAIEEENTYPLPHVTLARLKEGVDPKVLSFKPFKSGPLKVATATLYESNPQSEASSYTLLETFSYGL